MIVWVVASWKNMEEERNLIRQGNEWTAARGKRKEEGGGVRREEMSEWEEERCYGFRILALHYFISLTSQKVLEKEEEYKEEGLHLILVH